MRAVAKTSGSKGLHLSVGIRPSVDAETTKGFALALGQGARVARPEARDGHDGEGAARRARVRRLEPERPAQDHGVRVLAARDRRARRVDAGVVGRARPTSPTTATPTRFAFTPADVLERVDELGDLYADSLAGDQDLPELG